MSDPIKISRTLFVGLGGTGVKSILRAKQCFVDAYGEVPPMVAFLAIDTDKKIRDAFLPSRKGKVVKFTNNEICFCGISGSALTIYRGNPSKYQWLPKKNVESLANLKNTGAGQVRSSGRFLARYNATEISKRVASKVNEIGKPLPIGSKFVYDTNKDGVEYPVKVNVVGSVAGGTGSGMMLDMLVLIAKTLKDSGLSYSITPWMVLPEVFRHMLPGPASSSVYQNAYGLLRELDYLYHLPMDNQRPLDFNFDTVFYLDEGIGTTYLINNTNKAGIIFQNIDDITDSIGRCMFLPSNEVDSIEVNLLSVIGPYYNIRNKKAYCASAGSAEIVYDNQAVGNVIAKGIISQICNELCKADSINSLEEVNAWTTSEAVAIQEHEADLLIDSILPNYAPFSVIIDKDADLNTVTANIYAGAEADNVIEEVRSNEATKLETVKKELNKKIGELLNTQNGIGAAKAFLESLSDNIAICKHEMSNEASELKRTLAYTYDWNAELSALKTGIFNIFDKDAAEALQSKITEHIAQKRDLLRHNWAIQFFTDLDIFVNELSQKINVFKANIEAVERIQRRGINTIQQLAKSNSKFQIFLHSDEAEHFNLPDVKQTSDLFRSKNPIDKLIYKDEKELCDIFFDFAKDQQSVIDAVNISIEQKISSMTEEELKVIFAKVKELSSPLWSTKPEGYLSEAQELTTIFTIGVCDQSSSIIKKKFLEEFTIGVNKPTFASTHETDRITFFQTQCYSPTYAVNNMIGYMREAEDNLKKDVFPVYYLDEIWHQRMIAEGFDIMPKQEKDTVLPNWVNAIVYDFIKFDETRNTYYIKSKQGNKITGGFLALGKRRDLAFEQFQNLGLDKEVEERLQQISRDKGRPAFNAVISSVKNDIENYVTNYAQLSTIELDQVLKEDPTYQMVTDLLIKEITYLEELDLN